MSGLGEDTAALTLRLLAETVKISGILTKVMLQHLIENAKNKPEEIKFGESSLEKMAASGKETRMLELGKIDIKDFAKEAKAYGIQFAVLGNKKSEDKVVLFYAEDYERIAKVLENVMKGILGKQEVTASREEIIRNMREWMQKTGKPEDEIKKAEDTINKAFGYEPPLISEQIDENKQKESIFESLREGLKSTGDKIDAIFQKPVEATQNLTMERFMKAVDENLKLTGFKGETLKEVSDIIRACAEGRTYQPNVETEQESSTSNQASGMTSQVGGVSEVAPKAKSAAHENGQSTETGEKSGKKTMDHVIKEAKDKYKLTDKEIANLVERAKDKAKYNPAAYLEQIIENYVKGGRSNVVPMSNYIPQHHNFDQRKYDEEHYKPENIFDNLKAAPRYKSYIPQHHNFDQREHDQNYYDNCFNDTPEDYGPKGVTTLKETVEQRLSDIRGNRQPQQSTEVKAPKKAIGGRGER